MMLSNQINLNLAPNQVKNITMLITNKKRKIKIIVSGPKIKLAKALFLNITLGWADN
jgi:hypothetical protein|tara:strand:+ start:293 stop:463 length:171 start_codon:yes stop_codon:yes gene_type:complete